MKVLTSEDYSLEDLTPLQQLQLEREYKLHEQAIGRLYKEDQELYIGGRGSQATVSRAVMKMLVPAAAKWLELHADTAERRSNNVGVAIKEFRRMSVWMDAHYMAHIALATILDSLGRGQTFKTPINTLQIKIGRQVEDQALIEYIKQADPKLFKLVKKFYLDDPIRSYKTKVNGAHTAINRSEELSFSRLDDEGLLRLGALLLRAVMSVPVDKETKEGFFECRKLWVSKTKEVRYLGFSFTGIKYRDVIQNMADEVAFHPQPMLCAPREWTLTQRGGYLLPPPSPWGKLIHSHNKSVPSQVALDALNRLQKVPYNINEFVLDVQLELLKTTHTIGTFRSYEADTWKDIHFPRYSSEYIASLSTESEEYKEVMRELRNAYHNQKLDEKKALTPRRLVLMANSLRGETFYTPWYYDSRLRMYPICELGITGGDMVKALLVSGEPKPINEDTKRELLIAIATEGDFVTSDGRKASKVDYLSRYEWALDFVNGVDNNYFLDCVLNPLGTDYWRKADNPFLFLSCCEEYYALFVAGTRDTTRVFIGRDQTCSGIQILSSLIRDEKGMIATNVIPSDDVQDAYKEVSEAAQKLLRDPSWLQVACEKRTEANIKWNKKNPDKEPRELRGNTIDIPIEKIDRKVVKTSVMVTGYGGSYLSKREYIIDAINDIGLEIHPDDRGIVVKAVIDGMELVFPKYSSLNKWFREVASAACKEGLPYLQWTTPTGSLIKQEYRYPLMKQVSVHAAGGGYYGSLISDENGVSYIRNGWGEVNPDKMASATAANFTHSLDSSILHVALTSLPEDLTTVVVHDCHYNQAGYSSEASKYFRAAFLDVVSEDILGTLLTDNGLDGFVPMIDKGEVDISVCIDSPYMFS
jgi:DNA-directed RNA polymerase